MSYKTIPLKAETFGELKRIKSEAERRVGTHFDWNSFVMGLIGGAVGTAVGVAIAEAIKEWRERRKNEARSEEVNKQNG